MGLNRDPGGGGPLDGCSVTACVFFLDLGSEMTTVASSAGTMYRGLRLLTLFTMVLKEVSFLDTSRMVLKGHFYLTFYYLHGGYHFSSNGLERSVLMTQICSSVFSIGFLPSIRIGWS